MKKGFIAIFIFIQLAACVFAQEVNFLKYSTLSISDSLTKNANAVYRLDEGILEISSPSHYSQKVHQIVTLLNSDGSKLLHHGFAFDKFSKVSDVEVKMYNSLGMEVRTYKKKDFEVVSGDDGFSLVTDYKVMSLFTPAPGYPCTMDVKYEINYTSCIELPSWLMNTHSNSTELFRYIVKVPADLDIRYRSLNFNLQPEIQNTGKQKIYTWEAKNIPVKKIDEGSYEMDRYLPQVEIAPNAFEYDGYKGEFKDWKDFGKWNYSLYEEKTAFSEKRTAEIRTMVAGESDTEGKVKVLYEYLKKNTRYVSIQLGIGGFKPFTAKFVDEKKYGDCKALTNYMRNLLAVNGIKAYPALINAGFNKTPADPSFPSHVFNHVILCIPSNKDTIWLECTSNDSEAGFLGSFTENKNALLITENGGILVRTPKSRFENNKLFTHTVIFLHEEGAAASSKLYATGDVLDIFHELKNMDNEKQREVFVQYLNYKQPEKFTFSSGKDSSSGFCFNLDLAYDKLYDFKAGNKYFFPQHINRFSDIALKEYKQREEEYIFKYPFEKRDTTVFHLPLGFTIENLPASKELNNDFAVYKRKIHFDQPSQTIEVVSYLILKYNIIPPGAYMKLADFFNEVNKAEAEKIVLKKE